MSEDRRTMKAWAHRLSAPDEPLTMAEAALLASIAQADRLVETLVALQDMQMRLTRIELYMSETLPNYDACTQRAALASPNGPPA